MNTEKRIESLKPTRHSEKFGNDVYLILKTLNNKLEVFEDVVIDLKNQLQKMQLIIEEKNV